VTYINAYSANLNLIKRSDLMKYSYQLELFGAGVEFSIKDLVEDADFPDYDEFDEYPGDEIESYMALDKDSGKLIVEQIGDDSASNEHNLSDMHQLYSREAYCFNSPQEYFEDQVVCYRGEGKSGLGSVQLYLDDPFDIRKVSIGVIETNNGNYIESIFYGLKELALDMSDANFASDSLITENGYISKDDWDGRSGYTGDGEKLQDAVDELLLWEPNWPDPEEEE